MGLIAGALEKDMKKFLNEVNSMVQEDKDKAINAYAKKHEQMIYDAIRSIDIFIPIGAIKVQGSSAAQTNIAPIVLKRAVK